jgi:hypothetical protein
MRPRSSALMFSLLAACTGPNTTTTTTTPVEVNWMEWPAQVLASQPFNVRLLVPLPLSCNPLLELLVPATIDNSAVTFAPLEIESARQVVCPYVASAAPVAYGPWVRDTTVPVAGLAANAPRTYELRGAAAVYAAQATASALPQRTFGTVTVRLDSASAARINVGGQAQMVRDSLGCPREVPWGVVWPSRGYVVENPDTALVALTFVRGYLYKPAAPVCGATTVFHVVSIN